MDENELKAELERMRLDAETRKYEARQKVRQIVYGTMVVGLAAAAFPFAQKLAELTFQRDIEEIKQQTALVISGQEHTRELTKRSQEFLQSLGEEGRSEDITRRIRLAEFYKFLSNNEAERGQWTEYLAHLEEKRRNAEKDRVELAAIIEDPDSAETAVRAARQGIRSIDQYLEPKSEAPSVGLPTTPFLLPVEDVFSISGRGTIVTGRVERGAISVGDWVELVGIKETRRVQVNGVEMFRKPLEVAQEGDNVGLLLRGVERDEIERGMVLAAPGSITPHTRFQASVRILPKEEGGRHAPFFETYRPQFYFRTTDVTGAIGLPEGVDMVAPGDSLNLSVELVEPIALEKGQRFAIREGGRTIGEGTVLAIEN